MASTLPPNDPEADRITRMQFEALGALPPGPEPIPLTTEEFLQKAKPVVFKMDGGQALALNPRENKTGSIGWHASIKTTLFVDGVPIDVIANINVTVIGSKKRARKKR